MLLLNQSSIIKCGNQNKLLPYKQYTQICVIVLYFVHTILWHNSYTRHMYIVYQNIKSLTDLFIYTTELNLFLLVLQIYLV